jgi:hypothetical protein
MSQRGRGSGTRDDEPDDEADGRGAAQSARPAPSLSSRPIAPYDPYRSQSGSNRATRNVAGNTAQAGRAQERLTEDLEPDDVDPLRAEAWQLELDTDRAEDDLASQAPGRSSLGSSRRSRRPPTTARSREQTTTTERATRRSRSRAAQPSARTQRASIPLAVPQVVASSSLVADTTALALLGANLIGVVVMSLLVGLRIGGLPSLVVFSLDAAGHPDRWGPPNILWRLPLMSFFITLLFLAVAWFTHPIDRFAARFALGSALVAQLLAWVAVIQHFTRVVA